MPSNPLPVLSTWFRNSAATLINTTKSSLSAVQANPQVAGNALTGFFINLATKLQQFSAAILSPIVNNNYLRSLFFAIKNQVSALGAPILARLPWLGRLIGAMNPATKMVANALLLALTGPVLIAGAAGTAVFAYSFVSNMVRGLAFAALSTLNVIPERIYASYRFLRNQNNWGGADAGLLSKVIRAPINIPIALMKLAIAVPLIPLKLAVGSAITPLVSLPAAAMDGLVTAKDTLRSQYLALLKPVLFAKETVNPCEDVKEVFEDAEAENASSMVQNVVLTFGELSHQVGENFSVIAAQKMQTAAETVIRSFNRFSPV